MSNKLIYPISLVMVLALAGFAQAELLVNPGFEAGTPLNDTWVTWGGGSGSGAGGYFWDSNYHAAIIEDGTAHSGNAYVEAGFPDNHTGWWWNGMWVWQEHPVTEGKTYQISGWVRDADANGAASLISGGTRLSFEWRDLVPANSVAERGNEISRDYDPFDLTGEWTYVSATAVAPAGAVGISVGFNADAGINFDLDDASFVEVPPPAFGDFITIEVAASSDDAEEHADGSMESLTSSDLEFPYEDDPSDPAKLQTVGIRFVNVQIPKGETIANAFVRFDADDINDDRHVGDANLLIEGQLDPNADTFEDVTNSVTARARTTAQVQWSPARWVAPTHDKHWTSNITSIIQEIVNQDGWAAGNALVLIFSDDPSNPSVGIREAESFDGAGGDVGRRPTLFIEFGVAPAPDEIAREAESADVLGASWRLVVDPSASGGVRIGSENGDGNENDTAPGAEWVAAYNFDATGGTYKVVLHGQEADSDSFWIRILGATSMNHEDPDQPDTGWTRFNGMEAQGGWRWDEVHSNDHNNDAVYWTLPAGPHTIEIAKREDGAYLDGFIITNDLTLDQETLSDVINPLATAIVPSPADGAGDVRIGSTLSWAPAATAATHDVYFGTSSPPPFIGNQAAASFYPGPLETGTTYYWQVDEIQADSTTTTGDVWSFTTGFSNVAMDIMIATGTDDAEEDVGGSASFVIDLTSSDLELMYDNDPADPLDEQVVGIRFVDVGIPKGSTITSASVRFDADDVDDPEHVGNAYILIDGELSPDPVTFENTPNNITGRPKTTAQVPWTSEPWPVDDGSHQKAWTPDISSIIQEIVDQNDWAGGNALVLILSQDPATPSVGHRECESYNGADGNADQRPMLSISALVESATGPSPADGAEGVPIVGTILSWWPGAHAVSHDGYIGTTSPPPTLGNTPEVAFDPGVLQPGTTYYWQADAVEADGTTHTGAIWSFTTEPGYATQPNPANLAVGVALDATLSWSPGITAASHDVHFGTSSPPAHIGNQTETSFDPGPLEMETTYYWQIDEVEADGTTVYTGDVWSFKTPRPGTGSIARAVWEGISGTSISDLTGSPDYPDNPTFSDEMTLFETPTDFADNFGSRLRGYLHPDTSGDYTFWIATDDNGELWLSTDESPANAVLISTVSDWAGSRQFDDGDVTPSGPIPLVGGQKYYVEALYKEGGGGDNLAVAWEGPDSPTRAVIAGYFLSPYVEFKATSPDPADGTIEVPKTLTLSWTPGVTAASHDVYFSADSAAVSDGTALIGNQAETSYSPADLAKGTTYYWRVDEVEADGTTKHTGDVWSFTVTTLGR